MFTTCSQFVHYLYASCSLPFHFLASLLELFHFHYFTWPTSLTLLHFDYLSYLKWANLLTILPLNYFTLFTSVEVLRFSHLQSSEFTKSNNLNRLACLSLAAPACLIDFVWRSLFDLIDFIWSTWLNQFYWIQLIWSSQFESNLFDTIDW